MAEYYIGQIFKRTPPSDVATWCSKNNAYLDKIEKYRYQIKEIPEPPVPTKEEQSKRRANDYKQEVDPITSHIQRLRDKEQTEEIIAEINALIEERDAKVEEIKERYPYPTDPIFADNTEGETDGTEE